MADALRDVDYDGVVSMESFAPSMDADCFLWRRPFDDPDTFASEGLAHLRSTGIRNPGGRVSPGRPAHYQEAGGSPAAVTVAMSHRAGYMRPNVTSRRL